MSALYAFSGVKEESKRFLDAVRNLETKYPNMRDDLSKVEKSFQNVILRFIIQILDSANFHEMDEEISKGNLDPRFVPIVRNAIDALDLAAWPESLQKDATSLREDFTGLQAALINKKGVEATLLSHKVHEAEHKFHEQSHEWLSHS